MTKARRRGRHAPGLFGQRVLAGGLPGFSMTKACFAVATDRRLISIRIGLWFFGPKAMNLGIEEGPSRRSRR